MGRPKKTQIGENKKPCSKFYPVKVVCNNARHFENHQDARDYAIRLLQAGATFISIVEDRGDC